MSYSPNLSSAFNDTRMRGEIAVYPTNTGENQIASEKTMPIDYSHFNINGRVFGATGAEADKDTATIFNVKLERTIGKIDPVKLAMPIILSALIKLDWEDYFAALNRKFDIQYTDASDLIPLTLPAKEILQGKWF